MTATFASPKSATRRDKALAWGVHLLTASGFLVGLLAIRAILDAQWRLAFLWIGVTVFIDSIDGTLARRFRVKEVIPEFDGALLDNIVDYFTYVLVPVFMIERAALIPAPLLLPTIAAITISSAYQFCRVDAKTDDHYFKGFPSYWNLVAVYLLIGGGGPWFNVAMLWLCAVLVFVPIKYLYPSRTKPFQRLTLTLNLLWACAFLAMMLLYPDTPRWLTNASLFYLVYYVGLSVYLTVQTGGAGLRKV